MIAPFVVLTRPFFKFPARQVNLICPFPIPAGLTGSGEPGLSTHGRVASLGEKTRLSESVLLFGERCSRL
jgi:hypothetical protein